MANALSTFTSNLKANLTKVEAVLVLALSVQTLVVNFVDTSVPSEQKLVADIFGAVAFAAALIKGLLTNSDSKRA